MTIARWYVAKYVDDLRRCEPKNVGVVLDIDGHFSARFLGEAQTGSLDGRQLRWAKSPDVYRAWVRHWRASLGSVEAVESNAAINTVSNYFLVHSGERLAGDVPDAETFLESLYGLLVEQPKEGSLSLERLAEAALTEAGISDAVTRNVVVPVDDDLLKFDYRMDNGAANLIRRVPLSFEDDRSWEYLHAAKWAFDQSAKSPLDGKAVHGIALVRGPASSGAAYAQQLKVLRSSVSVVDVSKPDKAASSLRQALHI